jgi:hypothetical protein
MNLKKHEPNIWLFITVMAWLLLIVSIVVKDYGVKSSWDGWRTFAYVSDGTPMGMMPITWANELFKTKKQAKTFIDDLATKNGWKK